MSFEDHASYFAEKCPYCSNKRYITEKDKFVICRCQLKALIRHRCDQLPEDTKFMTWSDYTGDNIKEKQEVRVENWKKGRDIAFAYCFSKNPIKEIGEIDLSAKKIEKTLKKRISRSKILKRMRDGSNLVILGKNETGKTLLATLVAKEIIYASVLLGDLDFKWISFNTLINALSFDRSNYELIDEAMWIDFLVLDNVSVPHQGNYMKNVLDELFHDRLRKKMPTIITGSSKIENKEEKTIVKPEYGITGREALGDEFYKLLNSSNTVRIILKQTT